MVTKEQVGMHVDILKGMYPGHNIILMIAPVGTGTAQVAVDGNYAELNDIARVLHQEYMPLIAPTVGVTKQ